MSSLHIIYGPMFSGKTTLLLEKVDGFCNIRKNKQGIIINSVKDSRDIAKKGVLTTHGNVFITKNIPTFILQKKVEFLKETEKYIYEYDYIFIDECQFFEDLVPFVMKILSKNKKVFCAGLLTDVNTAKFGHLMTLIPHADETTQLKSICKECNSWERKAIYTKAKKELPTSGIFSSGEEHYMACCRKHLD